ncbi:MULTISPECIES: glycosyltransferase family 2 protein [Bacteroides]|uniref:glycosyltransferase family 2 protein n=1 Tax=Bacteroides TaxID=816 RepID=UPI000B381129|nr:MULTISPECIES: glycosyltransferase [Bacteroides]MBM6945113.1 glycosyltransferase [Bacteroides gallinaceum]OUO56762.1 glycosyl transferase family 2 [Bacteroides sp. An279]
MDNQTINNTALVSVVMPAYNAERFLREAIDSVLNQTYPNFELIIINDGSTDHTEEIILSYSDSRIKYVRNEQNLKLIKTLNKGVELAQGKYIARMDADDISLPERFEEEVRYLEEHPDVDIVSCFPYDIDLRGKVLTKSSYFSATQPQSLKFVSVFAPPICHPACMCKTEVLKKYKYSDKPECQHIEDYELWNRMFHTGIRGAVIPKFMFYYRANPSGICHLYNDEQLTNHIGTLKKSLIRYGCKDIDDDVAICIISKIETKNMANIDAAFRLLDLFCQKYLQMEDVVSKLEQKEINEWVSQRKIAILMTSAMYSSRNIRARILIKLLHNLGLLMNFHNLIYLKNRIVRIIRER